MKTKNSNTFAFGLLLFLIMPATAIAQGLTSLNTSAKGEGTISASGEQHKVYAVVVNLKDNGDAEITLVTDIQIFVQGRWSLKNALNQGIDLKITGGIVKGNATGTGKLFLRNDRKSIAKLTIQAKAADGNKVKVQFATKSAQQ